MAAYPLTLPAPLLDGYALSPVDPLVRTEMESGASRSRRRTKARNDRIDVSWCFTESQFAEFRTWFDDDVSGVSGGSSWFDISLNIGLGWSTLEEARFQTIWKAQKDGFSWKVSATLEVR